MKIILLLILLSVATLPAFSQSPVTFDIDTSQFVPKEIVEFKGIVDSALIGEPIAVEIKDAQGNVILIRTITSDSNGEFALKFRIPATAAPGTFEITTNAELDGQSFSATRLVESTEPESGSICGEGTVMEDGVCVLDTKDTTEKITEPESPKGGGCLIATATYGSELAPEVQKLREIRDNALLQTHSGTNFMKTFNEFYYLYSPYIADLERENPVFKEAVKLAITPMIYSLSILNYSDMDSEAKVLGYGISLILLNIGMYFAIPAIVIMKIKR